MTRESREEHGDLADLLLVGPFHQALRVAIQERSLTLERLRRRIVQAGVPVALSTLSDWQQGNRRPGTERSMRVVAVLEQILGLPPSSLRDLLDHESVVHDERGGAIGELLDRLPGSRDRDATILSQQQKVTVSKYGAASKVWNRTLIRARRDGVDRYFLRFFGGPGTVIDDVQLNPIDNCTLARVERHPTQPVLVAEYLFGSKLQAGETWVFEHQYEDHADQPDTEYGHGFRYMVSQYLLEVRFHPERLPAACYSYARRGLLGPPHRTGVLTLNPHHAVHLVASNVAAGVLGITWDWENPAG
ncbi:hypothetical protein Skr01_40950 [Sphaerisporangium krabiense]|uniref:XRE family transcriptional regulator n=1 Tax=Sphaerisporangium krabiense TaxID=763782 RepID=A0A7W8Z9D2_9ACTN|nr:hypothetical protein [Sphaerisporangium krabiense]MBB5629909.1 hypothetical protein [Sphaerisporangium krabiense]GII64010.1 hypothetical protein Skr01_40950 [Sphaerisporangium krabiense]